MFFLIKFYFHEKYNKKGWCGESKSCIKGTALAPTEPCEGTSYLYGNFNNNMNGLTANKNVNGNGSKK